MEDKQDKAVPATSSIAESWQAPKQRIKQASLGVQRNFSANLPISIGLTKDIDLSSARSLQLAPGQSNCQLVVPKVHPCSICSLSSLFRHENVMRPAWGTDPMLDMLSDQNNTLDPHALLLSAKYLKKKGPGCA